MFIRSLFADANPIANERQYDRNTTLSINSSGRFDIPSHDC